MKVSIEYECGETTCAIERGKFCKFVRVSRFGTKYHCALFMDDYTSDSCELQENEQGWLSRCEKCMQQGEKNKC